MDNRSTASTTISVCLLHGIGLKIRRRENSVCLWHLSKANTMLILFPKIRNEDFAKKFVTEIIQAKRQWDISTTLAQNLSWWTRKNLASFAWLLRSTQKVKVDLKISQTFWRKMESFREVER